MSILRTGIQGFAGPGISGGPASGGGPIGIFTPLDIPGLALWLRADAGTYQDVAMTVPAVLNGDTVGGWQDQSGAGNHATQAVAAQQPNLQLAIINGLPTVRFTSGNSDYLEILTGAALGITDTVTVFFVMIPNNIAARETMLGQRNLANAFQAETTAVGNKATLIPGVFVSQTTLAFLAAWEILTYRRTGAGAGTHTWRRNGGNLALVVNNPNAYAANGIKDIGRRAAGSQHFSGDFAEILVYTTNLSNAQIDSVELWLNGRYAIY